MNIEAPPSSPRRSIKENFRAMPGWLKLFTIHALVCSLVVPISLMPGPDIEDRAGIPRAFGPIMALGGLMLAAAGVLLLLRKGFGRHLYLGVFTVAIVGGQLYLAQVPAAAFGMLLSCALGAYLFRNNDVRAYFHLPPLRNPSLEEWAPWKSIFVGNAVPIGSLSLIALAALYLWGISDQPRMADGALTGDEMRIAEKVLTAAVTLSVFASLFVAARRAVRSGSWFWCFVCLFFWPAAYAYALLVNRKER